MFVVADQLRASCTNGALAEKVDITCSSNPVFLVSSHAINGTVDKMRAKRTSIVYCKYAASTFYKPSTCAHSHVLVVTDRRGNDIDSPASNTMRPGKAGRSYSGGHRNATKQHRHANEAEALGNQDEGSWSTTLVVLGSHL